MLGWHQCGLVGGPNPALVARDRLDLEPLMGLARRSAAQAYDLLGQIHGHLADQSRFGETTVVPPDYLRLAQPLVHALEELNTKVEVTP